MRGDRPLHECKCTSYVVATPHARGSTGLRPSCKRIPCGYPACAGIDLLAVSRFVAPWRLPRMRGDRPKSGIPATTGREATPHARGSTLAEQVLTSAGLGYPACAGIDLSRGRSLARRIWLPRMRGDRPAMPSIASSIAQATPHARGSTRYRKSERRGHHGYPACAGIDPAPHTDRTAQERLPRMRGDRPRVEEGVYEVP